MTSDIEPVYAGVIVAEEPINVVAEATNAWLRVHESEHTRDAYRRDLTAFNTWCGEHDIHPLNARKVDIDAYIADMRHRPSEFTGRPLARSTIARHLAAISSWYDYMTDPAVGLITASPMGRVKRPRVEGESQTIGMNAAELTAMIAAADSGGDREPLGDLCAGAIIRMMAHLGPRVTEVCTITTDDLGWQDGFRTVRLRIKGGKTRIRRIPDDTGAALDRWLQHRGIDPVKCDRDTPVFVNPDGTALNRHQLAALVKRCARRAGLDNAERITPHSFRHAWATVAREAGASLEMRQHALGHSDPRTTQRYDRARMSLETDPSQLVADATRNGR